jgi:hypothetical protein
MERSYKYLGYVFLLIIPLTLAGFYKTYLVLYPDFTPAITIFTHLHAAIACMWVALLIAQPFLAFNGKYRWHRVLGKLSYVIFPLFIISFVPQLIRIFQGDKRYMFFALADTVLMIAFYSLAILNRRSAGTHMRFMIALTIVFLGPTLGRIGPIWMGWSELVTQNVQYATIYGILLGLIFYDVSKTQNYSPYLYVIPFFIVHQLVYHLVFL